MAQLLQRRAGLLVHGLVIQKTVGMPDRTADEDIIHHRQLRHNVLLLIHAGDARRARLNRILEYLFFARDEDFALLGNMYAGQNLDERGLSRAVLTDQTMDFTRTDLNGHALQRDNAGKTLGNVFQLHHISAHPFTSLF